jgi:ABC-type phosphate transport system permease subunit
MKKLTKGTTFAAAFLVSLGLISIVFYSLPAFVNPSFMLGAQWSPDHGEYGFVSMLVGSLTTSGMSATLSFPFAVTVAVGGRFLMPERVWRAANSLIESFAGVPSLIFGLLAVAFWAPTLCKNIQLLFPTLAPQEASLFTGAMVLSIMLIPSTMAHCSEVVSKVKQEEISSFDALGLPRSFFVRAVVVPKCSHDLFSCYLRSWARGMGEAIALSLVIGRADTTLKEFHFFHAGQTLATKISSPELYLSWSDTAYRSSIFGLVVILLASTIAIFLCTQSLRSSRSMEV